jgi:preprotein translocase subunit SecB
MSVAATSWSRSTGAAAWCRCSRPDGSAIIDAPPAAAAGLLHWKTIMAETQESTPVFNIQRMYLKDLSLEQPNSPAILIEQQPPQVDINLAIAVETVAEGIFEVSVTATVTTKVQERTLFLIEAKQAGIFEIRNLPAEQMQAILGIACPGMVYPYLRAIVSDVCTRAGFPPVLLTEVNFQAMYEAQQQQQLAAKKGNGGEEPSRIVLN